MLACGLDFRCADQSSHDAENARPALVSCVVLVPRKPELAWGHEVVAVGQAEIAGVRFVGVVDNYFAPRIPGTIRWIQAERCSSLVLVRPRR